jgi:hypothetical protein
VVQKAKKAFILHHNFCTIVLQLIFGGLGLSDAEFPYGAKTKVIATTVASSY